MVCRIVLLAVCFAALYQHPSEALDKEQEELKESCVDQDFNGK
jgi:hypothetical protein